VQYAHEYKDYNNESLQTEVLEEPHDWIFTFGHDHVWPLTGTSLVKHYVVLNGTFNGTRDEMIRRFGNRWGFQYGSKKEAGVDRHELAELRLEFPDGKAEFI
jgi:hypothetical protein